MAEKDPMWTDALDGVTPAGPVTEEAYPKLVIGAAVRVVTKGGTVYEGAITSIPGIQVRRSSDSIVVCGRRFFLAQHDIYLIDAERLVEKNPPALVVTDEQVRDWVADLCRPSAYPGSKPQAVSPLEIAWRAIGFDPSIYAYGGSSKETAFTPFIKVGALKKTLAALVDDGVLRKVVSGGFSRASTDDRYVSIHGKAGYVTAAEFEESVIRVDGAARVAKIEALRKDAEHIVASRYPDEVETVLARLVQEAQL